MSNDEKIAGQDIKAGEELVRGPDGKLYPKKKRADADPTPEVERVTRDDGGTTVERTG